MPVVRTSTSVHPKLQSTSPIGAAWNYTAWPGADTSSRLDPSFLHWAKLLGGRRFTCDPGAEVFVAIFYHRDP